jgi:hypothetical protein
VRETTSSSSPAPNHQDPVTAPIPSLHSPTYRPPSPIPPLLPPLPNYTPNPTPPPPSSRSKQPRDQGAAPRSAPSAAETGGLRPVRSCVVFGPAPSGPKVFYYCFFWLFFSKLKKRRFPRGNDARTFKAGSGFAPLRIRHTLNSPLQRFSLTIHPTSPAGERGTGSHGGGGGVCTFHSPPSQQKWAPRAFATTRPGGAPVGGRGTSGVVRRGGLPSRIRRNAGDRPRARGGRSAICLFFGGGFGLRAPRLSREVMGGGVHGRGRGGRVVNARQAAGGHSTRKKK